MKERHTSTQGVLLSLAASLLFATIFYLSALVDVSANVVVAYRVIATVVLFALPLAGREFRGQLAEYWNSLTSHRWKPLLLPVLSALVGLQLWVFAWAPINGHALEASLGFLLLPIAMVFGGWLVLKDRLTTGQWIAVFLAMAAVVFKFLAAPQASWVTLVIAVGYPVYFIIRRLTGLDNPIAFGIEMAVLAPVAVFVVATAAIPVDQGHQTVALIAIGVAGTVAMVCYLAASRLLPLPLFGLLGYVEPVLLVAVALLLGERPSEVDLLVYGLLAIALFAITTDSFRKTQAGSQATN